MPCGYINFEKWFEWLEKEEEAKKKNITNLPDFYKILKKECGVKETTDQTYQSKEQT